MRVITDLNELREELPHPVMAIGVFDGVHLGHQRIIEQAVYRSQAASGLFILLSFDPHPQKVISSEDAPPLLQTFAQRAEILESLGIDLYLRLPFTRKLSLLSPEEFVREVIGSLGVREIHVGGNFRFGHRRSGDINSFRALGRRYGFEVFETAPVRFRNERISSTRIRNAIAGGRVALAKRLLGRPFEIRGNIVRGAQKGMQLGFPTANLATENELFPKTGVYATKVRVNGKDYVGATNIGFRPTVHGYSEPTPTIETHLLNFNGNLYGQSMRLEFCFRLRDEKRFDSLDDLKKQIKIDIHRLDRYIERIERVLEG